MAYRRKGPGNHAEARIKNHSQNNTGHGLALQESDGTKFARLLQGDWQGAGYDLEEEANATLLLLLRFWKVHNEARSLGLSPVTFEWEPLKIWEAHYDQN